MGFSIVLLIVLCVAALVATFVFLLPERRKARLNRFWRWVRDFLIMRQLYLEKILRTIYVVSTVLTLVLCIAGGFLSPFIMPGKELNFGKAIGGMLLGLLAGIVLAAILLFLIRIFYENVMLKVSLTDAAKRINQKLEGGYEGRSYEEPVRRPMPRQVVCRRCGARYDARRNWCPNCEERQ